MKIRIQDNSVRYRITLKELENLNKNQCIESNTEFINPITKEREGRFSYSVYTRSDVNESFCEIKPNSINLILCAVDVNELNDPNKEGVYIQKETSLLEGTVHRFMVFIEKDRPATKGDKRDEWIYEKDTVNGDKTINI